MPENSYLPEGMLYNTPDNRGAICSPVSLERAMTTGKILESVAAMCDKDLNLIVKLGAYRGIIYKEEAALGNVKDIGVISRVGKPVCFKVCEIIKDEAGNPLFILSRKAAQKEASEYIMQTLVAGDVIRCRVTHLESFGAFVDIGCGIVSLIGVENISVSRIPSPAERFSPGQEIYAAVLSVDRESGRICLTHKELLGTWEQNAALFVPGETVTGIIRGIEDYGIFVELTPNLSGLGEVREGFYTGEAVSVYIKNIIPEKHKIKLVIIDSCPSGYTLYNNYFIKSGRVKQWCYFEQYGEASKNKTVFLHKTNS